MADKYIFSRRDFDNDRQQVSFDVLEAGGSIADWQAWDTELKKWFTGNPSLGGFYEVLEADDGNASTDPIAQSRSQAIFECTDNTTGRVYRKRFPFPNLMKAADGATPPNPAFIASGGLTVFNPSHADYPLLTAALENTAVSPEGNSVTITRIYIEE